MGVIPAKDMEPFIDGLKEVADDLQVVLVLSGSPQTGLAVNMWTSLEGEDEDQVELAAWRMIANAAMQTIALHLKE